MTDILLVLVLALLIPTFALSVRLSIRLWQQETTVPHTEPAMDEEAKAEAEQGRMMDDGFNALMTYSVKLGRGRTSGGEP